MDFDPVALPWLPAPPPDWRTSVRALGTSQEGIDAASLRQLATYALGINEATAFGRLCDRAWDRIRSGGALDQMRVAYLGSGTSDFVLPAIVAGAARHGVLPQIYATPLGRAVDEAIQSDSALYRFGPQVAVIAFDHHGLGLTRPVIDAADADELVRGAVGQIELIQGRLAAAGVQCLLQTIPQPFEEWAGSADALLPGSVRGQIDAVNARIAALVEDSDAILLDAAALAGRVGTARWFNPRLYYQSKAPFDLDCAPLYGDHVGRLLAALRGRSRKALVLDLDNTLWGGVIGDDGLDGIRIGQGSAEGEAHLTLQTYARTLRERGIVLAVCSKNEAETALEPFRVLPDMVLAEDDFAVFVANWTDKGTNLRDIARTLNIGTDALVFCDDNPAERARVRQVLPEVAVPELPANPALYVPTLAAAGYFETVAVSEDDAKRAAQYRANAQRSEAVQAIGDMDTYLDSLQMACSIRPFDETGRTRIAQLINKTNQFNLTTRRYTPSEVAAMEDDPTVTTFQVRLEDKFGDNGMISVVILRAQDDAWVCDSWLMSCRVLGRRVEEAVLNRIVAAADAAGVTRIIGCYIPTDRNAMVADFWKRLGFVPAANPEDAPKGGTCWTLEVASYKPAEVPMTVTVEG